MVLATGCYRSGESDLDIGAGVDAHVLTDAARDPGGDAGWPARPCESDDAEGWAHCGQLRECERSVLCDSLELWPSGERRPYSLPECHPSRAWDAVSLQEAIDDGRVALDPEAARECFAHERTQCPSHDIQNEFPYPLAVRSACERMLDGTVPLGGDCWTLWDCAGVSAYAAMCVRGSACPGTCIALPEEGEPCAEGRYCRRPLRCASGVCLRGAEGDPCTEYWECAFGNVCLDREDGTRSCGPVEARAGEPCLWGILCTPPLDCVDEICVAPVSLGEACGASRRCGDGLRCVAERCAEIVMPGEPCDDRVRVCPWGLSCVAGRCAPLPVAGEACSGARPCVEGQCTDGTCVRLAAGQTCDPDSIFGECERFCSDMRFCRDAYPEGRRCASTAQCEDGLRCRGPEGDRACGHECGEP